MKPERHHQRKHSGARITLARALSKLGAASRSEARGIISNGRVTVNGRKVLNPDSWINPRTDRLALDTLQLTKPEFFYLAMHKPKGVVTTRSDELGRETVYVHLSDQWKKLFPVGRLDKETSGLLLFTNDTQWGEKIAGGGIPKVYIVQLDRALRDADCHELEKGMVLGDETQLRPATVALHPADSTQCRITITEGKNRQVRRMLEQLGYEVLALHRTAIGTVRLGTLSAGQVRPLTARELEELSPPKQKVRHARNRKPYR